MFEIMLWYVFCSPPARAMAPCPMDPSVLETLFKYDRCFSTRREDNAGVESSHRRKRDKRIGNLALVTMSCGGWCRRRRGEGTATCDQGARGKMFGLGGKVVRHLLCLQNARMTSPRAPRGMTYSGHSRSHAEHRVMSWLPWCTLRRVDNTCVFF